MTVIAGQAANACGRRFARSQFWWENYTYVRTAPGTRSANCESHSQGLANRYKGAIN